MDGHQEVVSLDGLKPALPPLPDISQPVCTCLGQPAVPQCWDNLSSIPGHTLSCLSGCVLEGTSIFYVCCLCIRSWTHVTKPKLFEVESFMHHPCVKASCFLGLKFTFYRLLMRLFLCYWCHCYMFAWLSWIILQTGILHTSSQKVWCKKFLQSSEVLEAQNIFMWSVLQSILYISCVAPFMQRLWTAIFLTSLFVLIFISFQSSCLSLTAKTMKFYCTNFHYMGQQDPPFIGSWVWLSMKNWNFWNKTWW